MRYNLDDMYGMLKEYNGQSTTEQVKEQRDMMKDTNTVVSKRSVPKQPKSVNGMPDGQAGGCDGCEDYSPVNESSANRFSAVRTARVSAAGFGKDGGRRASAGETCALRDIPKCLVEMAKRSFPQVPNYIAVSAFLFAYRDKELNDIDYSTVPDSIRELARTFERRNEEMRTSADIKRINDNIRRLNKVSDDVILALSYLIYDAGGFRRTEPAHPGEIDFYDPGIQKVTEKLEAISDKLRDERNYQQGKKKNMYGQKG